MVSNVEIEQNKVTIDSNNLPELDKIAEISFYNINFVNPVVLKNGQACEECQILSYENGVLVIGGINSFSTYEVAEGSGPVCGNGIKEGSEECDAGNLDKGDGCNAQCQNERSNSDGANDGGTNDGGTSGSGSSSSGSSGSTGSTNGGSSGRQSPPRNAQYEDGNDNDNDGLIDYPLDLGCVSYSDSSEEEIVREDCVEDWKCEDWSECANSKKTRLCYDSNDCGSIIVKNISLSLNSRRQIEEF